MPDHSLIDAVDTGGDGLQPPPAGRNGVEGRGGKALTPQIIEHTVAPESILIRKQRHIEGGLTVLKPSIVPASPSSYRATLVDVDPGFTTSISIGFMPCRGRSRRFGR